MRIGNVHGRQDVRPDPVPAPVEFDVEAVLLSEMSITTSIGYPDELGTDLNLLPTLDDKLDSLIAHRFPFDCALEAFGAARKANAAKVVAVFGDER